MSTKLLDNNLLDTTVVANVYISSEQAAFPDENLYNAARRSKVWRSNGFWEVTSANSTLVFRETSAVDLTATLTEAEYNSSTSFFSHVKTQMEAVGSSTYTISQDSDTKKVKFVSDGLGGGGIFEIDWTSSTGLATTLGFDETTEDTGSLTYSSDELRIASEEWIKWDFGISTNPTAFVLIGKRNSPLGISPSATVKLQGNETDNWTSPSYNATLTVNDGIIVKFKDDSSDGLHTEALRYWRLLIQDLDNPLGYVEAGAVYLGTFFEPTRGAVQIPFTGQYIDRSETVFSEGGQSFTDVREKSESFKLEWFGLTVSDKELIDQMFDKFGTSQPLFMHLDPNAVMSSTSSYFLRYVKFVSPPQYTLVSPGVYSVSMDFREEL